MISESRKLAYLRGLFFEYDAELGQVSKRSETPKGPFMDGH
jgi:hypothetical protein